MERKATQSILNAARMRKRRKHDSVILQRSVFMKKTSLIDLR